MQKLEAESAITEGDETQGSDDIWAYYEEHKDELEDLDEYACKRGLSKTAIVLAPVFIYFGCILPNMFITRPERMQERTIILNSFPGRMS
jgi:hypothetical protein